MTNKLKLSQIERQLSLVSQYSTAGDQQKVIDEIQDSILSGRREQTIKGVTGCGKTFIMANIIKNLNRPALILAHNKTLAAQLAEEFSRFFPDNAVHYFVSYYDYYQPESYIPKSDTFIEKQTQINEDIEKLRNASTQSLLTRRDTIIVASVSCIYGLGNPDDYNDLKITVKQSYEYRMDKLIRRLVDMQYDRTQLHLKRGFFKVKAQMLEVMPSGEDFAYRLSFWGDELEKIQMFDPITNDIIGELEEYTIFPAKQYVTTRDKIKNAMSQIETDMMKRVDVLREEGLLLPAERLKQRTMADLEMLETLGYCSGIENYSSYFDGRNDGTPPSTLIDYFPDDFITFIDESHITLPQIGAMYVGDRSRKSTLVEYGFRLPSALNNRPLKRDEFFDRVGQLVYVSATPGLFEQGIEKPIEPPKVKKPRKKKGDVEVEQISEIKELNVQ
jgi:excinuclease ABC subunit B